MLTNTHHSGFVSIIGKPNVGKSTLYNALMRTKLSITNPKAQTTRHRILGIDTGDNHQIVYSDTPGILKQVSYKLHDRMMGFVKQAFDDSD
ncbi:50S ribosome-binding GTPase, partial [Bacteroidia bacterium]|nr:50S ribosome-binding GTPase [Bacteroidia bacterium]